VVLSLPFMPQSLQLAFPPAGGAARQMAFQPLGVEPAQLAVGLEGQQLVELLVAFHLDP